MSLRRVIVTRAAEQADALVSALHDNGLEPVLVPTIEVELEPSSGDLDDAARHLGFYAWVVITSTNGVRAFLRAAERVFTPFEASRFAAIGSTTRRALELEGIDVAFQPGDGSARVMAAELPVSRGEWVLVIRGNLADEEVPVALRARGALVDDIVAYRTHEGPASSRRLLRAAFTVGALDAVVFTSGSTVRGLVALADAESLDVRSIPAVCIGPETAGSARAAGFRILAVSPSAEASALADATAAALIKRQQAVR